MALFLFIAALIVVVLLAWFLWPQINHWFSDSETLFWGRLQMLFGAVLTVLTTTDLTPIFASAGLAKWLPLWVVISGIITEMARKSRASDV